VVKATQFSEFYEYYKKSTESSMDVHVPGEEIIVAPCDLLIYQPHVERIQAMLDALFTKSWDEFLLRRTERETELNLKKFVDQMLKETATRKIALQLDDEEMHDDNLEALVSKKVAAGLKPMRDKINQLETSAKNVPRGAKLAGPLPKNKTQVQTKKKGKDEKGTQIPKGRDKPAAAGGNDSSNAYKGKKKKNGANQSKNGKGKTKRRTAQ
jgi:hypothetical protein